MFKVITIVETFHRFTYAAGDEISLKRGVSVTGAQPFPEKWKWYDIFLVTRDEAPNVYEESDAVFFTRKALHFGGLRPEGRSTLDDWVDKNLN